MPPTSTRIKSLRYGTWPDNPTGRDIGEALRDLFEAVRALPEMRVAEFQRVVWATPFHIACDHIPKAVVLSRCKLSTQPATVDNGAVDWTYINSQVRVDGIVGLTVGTEYDLVFQVIG